jgi:hypothetical protein
MTISGRVGTGLPGALLDLIGIFELGVNELENPPDEEEEEELLRDMS